jgi:ATP-dependent exoDNAse (exonuclease V) beta subunit
MKKNWTLSEAAAGTGKTVELVRQYLDCLRAGLPVEQIVAITFTRKAAAELLERVSEVLYYLMGGPGPQYEKAAANMGGNFDELYGQHAPKREERTVIQQALAGIGAAPVGTIDSFVQKLLSEFALHAVFPVPGGEEVPLDFPIGSGADPSSYLEDAVRELLTPREGPLEDEVRELLRYYGLGQLVDLLSSVPPRPVPPPASLADSYGEFARQYADYLNKLAGMSPLSAYMVETLGLDADEQEGWEESLAKMQNAGGKPAVSAVIRWLRTGAKVDHAPPELLSIFSFAKKKSLLKSAYQTAMAGKEPFFATVQVDAATVQLSLDSLVDRLPAWQMEEGSPDVPARKLADRLRGLIDGLRRRVANRGWQLAAQEGALGYDALLQAAIRLCQQPPDGLKNRFQALLVDEVQDSSREQIDFYLQLAKTNVDMRCFFVGDSRQSIYLFRKADPTGLNRLRELCSSNDKLENYRSIPALVEAHRELFSPALNQQMEVKGWEGLQDLTGLKSGLRKKAGQSEQPVLLIRDVAQIETGEDGEQNEVYTGPSFMGHEADARALERFADHLRDAWEQWERDGEDSPAPTAAVLVPTWKKAAAAKDILRARLGPDRDGKQRAYLDGGGRWLAGRIVKDVLLLLRALVDPADQIAWLGVWKHPAVGLSDAALSRVRRGAGIVASEGDLLDGKAPAWMSELGYLVRAEALEAPHDEVDIGAFAVARDPLRDALAGLMRDGVAHTLDLLATRLNWRELVAVAPDDDSPAQFEMLLEWLRSLDHEGMDPAGIVELLESDLNQADPPKLEVHRPDQHVSCITVYKAKGLQWDYVCVLSPGVGPGGGGGSGDEIVVKLGDDQRNLMGVRFDPHGALVPQTDGVGRLAKAIGDARKRAELLRLTYVAVTRAKSFVVMALPNERVSGLQLQLREVWKPAVGLTRIQFEQWEEASEVPLSARATVVAVEEGGLLDLVPKPRLWLEETPSVLHAAMNVAERAALADEIVENVSASNSFVPKCYDLVEAPSQSDFAAVKASNWGTLVHGWFEQWRFDGPPDKIAIESYLKKYWEEERAPVVDFLLEVSTSMASHPESALWQLVTSSGARLHFEWPFIGEGAAVSLRTGEGKYLLTGSIDLLLQTSDSRWLIIDFKAGNSSPTTLDHLARDAHLKTYGPQLEGYRSAVNGALAASGAKVEKVGLWFVRTGAGLLW